MFYSTSIFCQQPGALDSTFDMDGKVVTSIGSVEDRGFAMAIQQDGKIVVGGDTHNGSDFDFALVRYNKDGGLDSTFGINGKVITNISIGDDKIWTITIQNDGRIVAGGETYGSNADFALARYDSNGALDNNFGVNGIQITPISSNSESGSSLKISPNGKIYLGGHNQANSDFIIASYDSNGVLDTNFNGNGIVIKDFGGSEFLNSIALQNDGKIIMAGQGGIFDSDFTIVRYDSTGLPDTTFGVNGIVTTDISSTDNSITSISIQQDGKIIAGGAVDYTGTGQNWEFVVARYNTNGTLDTTFNSNGIIVTAISSVRDLISEVEIQTDGKIVAAGYSGSNLAYNFALTRYNTNGTLDNTFGNNGKVLTDFAGGIDLGFGMGIQADHKIVVAGETHDGTKWNFAVARYFSGLEVGVIDFANSKIPLLVYPNPVVSDVYVNYTLTENEQLTFSLYDLNGRLVEVLLTPAQRTKGEHTEHLMLDELMPAGNYILSISNGKNERGIKIIKN